MTRTRWLLMAFVVIGSFSGCGSGSIDSDCEDAHSCSDCPASGCESTFTNANLESLMLSAGDYDPAFDPSVTTYSLTVPNPVDSTTVTPTAVAAAASVTVNGAIVASGRPSNAIALDVGANSIAVVVTAPDGTTQKTYTVAITRQPGGGPHVAINATDRFFEFDGRKRFLVGSYYICASPNRIEVTEPCETSIKNNPDVDYAMAGAWWSGIGDFYEAYDANGKYFDACVEQFAADYTGIWNDRLETLISKPHWMGFLQPDEPDLNHVPLSQLQANWANKQTRDPTHPMGLTMCCKGDLDYYVDVADYLNWDTYTFNRIPDQWRPWPQKDWMYVWENRANLYVINRHDIEAYPKPVIATVQAYGVDHGGFPASTPTQLRANAYLIVATGHKGISFWSYQTPEKGNPGLWRNKELTNYVNQLARELHGFDWLFLPSVGKSWQYGEDDSAVKFSNNPSVAYHYGSSRQMNYMLKHKDQDRDYLIVINKDVSPIATTITIPSLAGTGARTATTIGLEGNGSAKAGQAHAVSDGVFSDAFDGYAVHAYEILSK